MSEAATSGGDREIEETVTAASTEDAWTQLIGRADIDKAVAAAQPTSGDAGLPWSYEDTWPLSERQLRHLSFELLLLCPPGELEAEARRLYGLAAGQGDARAQNNLGFMHDTGRRS